MGEWCALKAHGAIVQAAGVFRVRQVGLPTAAFRCVMYQSYFHLKENPFALTADPRFMYRSREHGEALAYLARGVFGSKGFLALTGEVGLGKTTAVQTFVHTFRPCLETAFIHNPNAGFEDLLYMVLQDFGCLIGGTSKGQMIPALNEFLIEKYADGKVVVLVIDEAQNLPPDLAVLEELRMVSNLEVGSDKLIQIVLVGQPELDHMLRRHELRQLRQRIPGIHRMQGLSRVEVRRYIDYRLGVAGLGNGCLKFTSDAVDTIHSYTGGMPRLINLVCDKILQHGYLVRIRTIEKEMVEEGIKTLD